MTCGKRMRWNRNCGTGGDSDKSGQRIKRDSPMRETHPVASRKHSLSAVYNVAARASETGCDCLGERNCNNERTLDHIAIMAIFPEGPGNEAIHYRASGAN
jgi:hypothetical protein